MRIPKTSHDTDVEVYDGQEWKPMKIHVMLFIFINKAHRYLAQLSDEKADDVDLVNSFIRFDKWTPNTIEELEKKIKRDTDEEGRQRTYKYATVLTQ
eukprot:19638-Eustigmatos_ZCMA.PRE.1